MWSEEETVVYLVTLPGGGMNCMMVMGWFTVNLVSKQDNNQPQISVCIHFWKHQEIRLVHLCGNYNGSS